MTPLETARHGLEMIDVLLQERPARIGHDFSEATRCIAEYRDDLRAAWRRTRSAEDERRLGQANAVLSVVVGGHYPLGPVPWEEIEKARHAFAALLESHKANATA